MAEELNSDNIAEETNAEEGNAAKDEVVLGSSSAAAVNEQESGNTSGSGFLNPKLAFAEKKSKPEAPVAPANDHYVDPKDNPEDFFGWAMCSYNLMREGKPEKAWEAALKALELGTNEPDLYIPLCQQFEPAKRRELADAAMKKTPPQMDAFQWLWVEVALSYWYEQNYSEAIAEYETILMQKKLDPGLIGVIVNGLAMSLEAEGRYSEAEAKYLEVGNQESAVRARMHSGDLAGALEMMKKGICPAEQRVRAGLEGTISCLLGCPQADLAERIEGLLDIEQDFAYKDFMLGMMYVTSQQVELGVACVNRFLDVCSANPKEWGVTLRWEIKTAQEVRQMLADSYGI